MAKAGRPKLPKKSKKANMLRVMMTDDQREIITNAAESAGKSESEWAREVLLHAAVTQKVAP